MFDGQFMLRALRELLHGVRSGVSQLFDTDTRSLGCLHAPAELSYDDAGVPRLSAGSDADLFALQGYVHARDRLFQMELMRRIGRGQLSELVGRKKLDVKDWTAHFKGMTTVELDALLRAFRLEAAAKRSEGQTSSAYNELLACYAAGVNEFVHKNPLALPLELRMLGARFTPWTALDCHLVCKAYAFTLCFSWQAKLTLHTITRSFPERAEELRRLMCLSSAGVEESQACGEEYLAFTRELAVLGQMAVDFPLPRAGGIGSNGWAVAGGKTASGKPVVAADPHLPTMAPSLSYFQHLEAPGVRVSGLTAAGIPGVTMGHNEQCAFVLTHAWVDDCDLFREQLDGDRCLGPEGWVPLEVDEQEIKVRGESAVPLRFRSGPHGPLLSDILAMETGNKDGRDGIALRWTGQDGGRDLEAFWQMDRSQSWGEMRRAAGLLAAPAYSLVYGDRDGHVGYQLAGWVPRRPWQGGVGVLDGSRMGNWSGYLSFQELPSELDPESGVVVSANQQLADASYPHYLSDIFEPPFRAQRAREQLSHGAITVDRCRELQLDVVSDWAHRINSERLQPLLKWRGADSSPVMDADARLALMLLQGWSGEMAHERIEPTVFWAFIESFVHVTLHARLGPHLSTLLLERYSMPAMMVDKMLARGEPLWFDPSPAQSVQQALAMAVQSLRQLFGPTTSRWVWGRVHRRTQRHLFSDVPGVGRFFDIGPTPASGDNTTISSGMLRFSAPFDQLVGADCRLIIDLADFDRCRWISATGQSGNPLSRHYRDQHRLFVAGEDRPWFSSPEALSSSAKRRLSLQPSAS